MTEPGNTPTGSAIADWTGNEAHPYWKRVTHLIEHNYLDVFTPEWLFGGRRHGWSLRYKKTDHSVR